MIYFFGLTNEPEKEVLCTALIKGFFNRRCLITLLLLKGKFCLLFRVLTLAAPRSIKVGPSPIVYIDLRITDTKKGRIPTGLEMKNSIAVQNATAIQRRSENNGESVPV